MISHKLTVSALAVAAVVGTVSTASAATVDTELSLVIDVSGSINPSEFAQQITGYVNAFRDMDVINAITSTANGKVGSIAVNAVAYGRTAAEGIGYMLIDSAASSNAFADMMAAFNRNIVSGSSTNIGAGIDVAVAGFASNSFDGARQVIDVSGDGTSSRSSTTAARDNACGAGGVEAINGIAIESGSGNTRITDFYRDNVICGTGSFVFTSTGFDTFGDGIKRKLIAEIAPEPNPIPLPAPAALLLAGLAGLGVMRRKK